MRLSCGACFRCRLGLCEQIALLVVAGQVLFSQAWNGKVEPERDARTERPADGPGPTDASKSEQGCEDKYKGDAQDEVSEGAHHKSHVSVAAAHRAVRHDLDVDGEKEESGDANELRARRERECVRFPFGHKQAHERFGEEEGRKCEHSGQQSGNDQCGVKSALYAAEFMRAEVLRNKVGQPVGAGAKAGGAEH